MHAWHAIGTLRCPQATTARKTTACKSHTLAVGIHPTLCTKWGWVRRAAAGKRRGTRPVGEGPMPYKHIYPGRTHSVPRPAVSGSRRPPAAAVPTHALVAPNAKNRMGSASAQKNSAMRVCT